MSKPVATRPTQSEAIDRRINELELRGWTQVRIAAEVGMSPRAVRYRLRRLNQEAIRNREEYVARELRTLDYTVGEALEAWDESKATGDPNPAFLGLILRGSDSRRKLTGADAFARSIDITLTPEELHKLSDEELEAIRARLR